MSERDRDLLRRLLGELGLEVPETAEPDLLVLRDELLRWNRRINLTAIRDPREALEKHLVDSLTLCPLLHGRERLLDLGSGGGFPGLPLQIARPGLQVVSVDSVRKKIAFQRHMARTLSLEHFVAWPGRAETVPDQPGWKNTFEVVVSRAFTDLPTFAALALPCLAPGGRIVAMKGPEGHSELQAAREGLERLGVFCREVRSLVLPASGARRCLVVLRAGAPQDVGAGKNFQSRSSH
jgi:16S rRNA (guanine527-N7)-methyltransferase